MQYLKGNTKYSINVFLVIVLAITISIPTLAKTKAYFSLYANSLILSITSPKPEVQTINTNTASQDELIKILQISGPLAQRIIAPREELEGFKESQDLTQLPEKATLEWEEWKELGIIIIIDLPSII